MLATENAVEVGTDTIDGVEVRQYRVEIDVAAALAAVPQSELDETLGDTGLPAVELPDTIGYDVWVTADNQLRRVSFATDIGGRTIGMQLDMTTSNEPLGIELPAADDVFDLTGLLGF